MEQREDISADKLRGGYYTPAEIADFLVNWGMEISPSHILEPSCGDGVFIKAMQRFASKDESELGTVISKLLSWLKKKRKNRKRYSTNWSGLLQQKESA